MWIVCWKWGPYSIPELTDRENIYLNGAILGMTKAEVDRKFDEIVDFVDPVGPPVKYRDMPEDLSASGGIIKKYAS